MVQNAGCGLLVRWSLEYLGVLAYEDKLASV